jgi:hypothetical protein
MNAPAYLAALDELGAAVRECGALAALLTYFAGQLRGEAADPEGPPLEAFPTPARVRKALARRDQAMDRAGREWERLPGESRGATPPPGELVRGGDSCLS